MQTIAIIIIVIIVLLILVKDHICFTKDEGDTENELGTGNLGQNCLVKTLDI